MRDNGALVNTAIFIHLLTSSLQSTFVDRSDFFSTQYKTPQIAAVAVHVRKRHPEGVHIVDKL